MTGRPPAQWLEKLLPRLCLVLGSLLFLAGRLVAGTSNPPPSPAEAEFFEKEIRPVLVRSCGECHGTKQHRGELRLDSRQGVLKGGETGPAVVLGDPAKSLLILAVRHEGDLQMPPKGKLKDEQITALERWVKMGAPWPAEVRHSSDDVRKGPETLGVSTGRSPGSPGRPKRRLVPDAH